jgi:hypothetical protein
MAVVEDFKQCVDERSSHDPWLQAMTRLATLGGSLDQYKHTPEALVPQNVKPSFLLAHARAPANNSSGSTNRRMPLCTHPHAIVSTVNRHNLEALHPIVEPL